MISFGSAKVLVMPQADFFSKLGVFVVTDFLDAGACLRITREAVSAAQSPLSVVDSDTSSEKFKPSVRRTKTATVTQSTVSFIQSRLQVLRHRLECHFDVALDGCEIPQFLVYDEGDFFRPHTDSDDMPSKPAYVRNRKLSVVIFLNSESSDYEPGDFEGGSLILYGLVDDPRWKTYGFKLISKPGLLIVFPSPTIHEVTAVTSGRRCSIATWF
ncbi:MAG: 2OG-Fe(II) oxygenase [Pyrinomonadaceae bacterium]|nr:2OG-Fe(II) oxygenase [Pyrinomonadaceae bacterium]